MKDSSTSGLWQIFIIAVCMAACFPSKAQNDISITTDNIQMVLRVDGDRRLYQEYLGKKLPEGTATDDLSQPRVAQTSTARPGWEVYPVMGSSDYYEPALEIRHGDGNPTSELKYVSHSQEVIDGGTLTSVRLEDEVYPLEVVLFFEAYEKEDVIKEWSEIRHGEDGDVYLTHYASSMLYFESPEYYLTEFANDWAREMRPETERLAFGKKIVDSHLGTRAAMLTAPFFEIGFDGPAREDSGCVLMGTLCWTGNFRFTFEVDHNNGLRVVSGINPDASAYLLKKGETFLTPAAVFTLSFSGVGKGSRNLGSWVLNHQLRKGGDGCMTLLNNWESTGYVFDEEKLSGLFDQAVDLGVDLFLLDDGWFGNKYPRNDDHTSLGDWEADTLKLPRGIPHLVSEAEKKGVAFGLWIEPEMVSEKSVLAETHPDWILRISGRKTYYFRNQLVLDLARPEVQDFCYGVVEGIMRENPGIKLLKWDCNSPIVNAYSPYEGADQGRLYIDYVRGLYNVLHRVRENYPGLEMMLCAGGGGRTDYGALEYFTEFWPSDNTSPFDRLRIQWGYSQFMPSKTICAHVTSWDSSAGIKFRVDVAFPFKMGFDINTGSLTPGEKEYCRTAVREYNRLKPLIFGGDLYRIVAPYDGRHCVMEYADRDKTHALVFAYDMNPDYAGELFPVKLEGLKHEARYRVREICTMTGQEPRAEWQDRVYTGAYLMDTGIRILSNARASSRIVELTLE
ncbi:MAG: alpha-galactosidase [Prevotella sp.]|nr:alpha-galactosidase [Prevotella sp.]